ncbi:MAG TPA: hypothetical protein PLX18_09195 [Anaerohalosphaeraceae bacterium]|jgi:ABC-type Co2+ transport system permease subunit|nr:hypothetical protein [Phycisphaerae bacterium]HOM61514.1 hypothetical protein [Anaerohalosphaeraceae bacterium]HOT73340.1 hypothetical protein [Anaerohalosphaeraceae bacterium]HPB93534.1 hypothetical protein [Anaerohalosphaeraceae bacterium]HQG06488.1 hypothetical protein [Anaerohalosphaeraceae bacterium]
MKKFGGWIFLGLLNGVVFAAPCSAVPALPSSSSMLLISIGAVLLGLVKK